MVFFPNAKINLGLHITGKRSDGYHDLETLFYPVNIHDAIEIIANPEGREEILFSTSGNPVDVCTEDNLCVKAFRLLKKDFPQIPSMKIHLHKNIPTGAGLGGGSADAVAVLKLLIKKFNLQIGEEKLLHYSLLLGSDCPFFVRNTPSLAKGRGEKLSNFPVDLSGYSFLIVHPAIHINTSDAFGLLDPTTFSEPGTLETVLRMDVCQWKDNLRNDFEKALSSRYPIIEKITRQMYASGAVYSSMSGSGSSVYGIFKKTSVNNTDFPKDWFCQMV